MPGLSDAATLTGMRLLIAALAVSGALVAAGCGGSSSGDAKAKACDAQISKDLDTIATEAPKVTGDLSDQLKTANETFKKSVQETADSVTSAGSVTDAAAAVSAAGEQLAASYKSAFADVSC
jgi:hypothetical protein